MRTENQSPFCPLSPSSLSSLLSPSPSLCLSPSALSSRSRSALLSLHLAQPRPALCDRARAVGLRVVARQFYFEVSCCSSLQRQSSRRTHSSSSCSSSRFRHHLLCRAFPSVDQIPVLRAAFTSAWRALNALKKPSSAVSGWC